MLLYFNQYANADPTSAPYQNAFCYYGPNVNGGLTETNPNPNDFTADVANGTLPQVSWIISPDSYDEHPPAPAQLGEWYTQQILDTLTSNPEVWASTVLFIMYDENDGFFDHVPPPTASGRHRRGVPDRRPASVLGGRHRRPDRLGCPGPDDRGVALLGRGMGVLRRVRPHLPTPVPGLAVQC